MFLRSKLGCEPSGKFNINIEWISLRFGFEKNQIVLSNFEWKNTPTFKNTPYFIKINEITLSFDIYTIYYAITDPKNEFNSIRIHDISIDTINIYIEKHEGLLNLWAALGAENANDEKNVKSGVLGSMSAVVETTASTSKKVGKAVIKYNPLSLLMQGAISAGQYVTHTTEAGGTADVPVSVPDTDLSPDAEVSAELVMVDTSGGETSEGEHVGRESYDAGDDSDADSGHDEHRTHAKPTATPNDINRSTDTNTTPGNDVGVAVVQKPKKKASGFGVPYRFEINQLYVHDLKLHAQDFLNASHVDAKKASAIYLQVVTMFYKDLTKKYTGKQKRKGRVGLFLDDITWRIVNKLIAELVNSNKMAMFSIFAAAAANQTGAAVYNVASTTTDVVITGAGLAINATGTVLKTGANATGSVLKTGASATGSVLKSGVDAGGYALNKMYSTTGKALSGVFSMKSSSSSNVNDSDEQTSGKH